MGTVANALPPSAMFARLLTRTTSTCVGSAINSLLVVIKLSLALVATTKSSAFAISALSVAAHAQATLTALVVLADLL